MVVVSHDRYLIERVCDQVVALFGEGGISNLTGGIEEYLRRRDQQLAAAAAAQTTSAAPKVSDAAEQRAARKELSRLERRLDVLTKKEGELHAKLAEAATDPDRLLSLDAELRTVLAEKDDVEEQWMLA